jgi:hypothetical protein
MIIIHRKLKVPTFVISSWPSVQYGTAVVPSVPRVPGEERIGLEDRVYTHITY